MGVGVTFVPEKRDKTFCPLPRFFLRFATVGIIAAQNYSGKDAIEQLVYEWYDAKKVQVVTPQRSKRWRSASVFDKPFTF